MTNTLLYMIRHGQSEANLSGRFTGNINISLTDLGRKQAELTALSLPQDISAIYSSDLDRAVSTAEPIARRFGLPIIKEQGLREINAGKWEGMLYDDIVRDYGESYSVWLNDIGASHPDGGESVRDMATRVYDTVLHIAESNVGKAVCITTHATPIRIMRCLCECGDISRLREYPWPYNCSTSLFELKNGKIYSISYSNVEYLQQYISYLHGQV